MSDQPTTYAAIAAPALISARLAAGQLDRVQRASLVRELIGAVYEHVKYDDPEGGGLDGRDGPERMGLAEIVDAAADHVALMLAQAAAGVLAPSASGSTAGQTPTAANLQADQQIATTADRPADKPLSEQTDEEWEDGRRRWQQDPTEVLQEEANQRTPLDDKPVSLTVFQMDKCTALLNAYLDDHTDFGRSKDMLSLYAEPMRLVERLLTASAWTGRFAGTTASHAMHDTWPEIEKLPWPPPRHLRTDQPD